MYCPVKIVARGDVHAYFLFVNNFKRIFYQQDGIHKMVYVVFKHFNLSYNHMHLSISFLFLHSLFLIQFVLVCFYGPRKSLDTFLIETGIWPKFRHGTEKYVCIYERADTPTHTHLQERKTYSLCLVARAMFKCVNTEKQKLMKNR